MNVSPIKVPNARALRSVDGIIIAVEIFSLIGVFAATALLAFLLYDNPAAGALWLASPLCLALLIGSAYKVHLDWKRIGDAGSDGEPETQTDGSPAS